LKGPNFGFLSTFYAKSQALHMYLNIRKKGAKIDDRYKQRKSMGKLFLVIKNITEIIQFGRFCLRYLKYQKVISIKTIEGLGSRRIK
jgi:hypothetical protein